MKIYLTFDYELYFGERTGSVENCIINPTRLLKEVADKHQIKLVQFVDVGFILALEKYKVQYPQLTADYDAITNQVRTLYNEGHDIRLHIHPHWEDCKYNGQKWEMDVSRYKLADFNKDEISDILHRYKSKLEELTEKGAQFTFRAGGWCIQPFEILRDEFIKHGVLVDSSVFQNGHYESTQYNYDFRNACLKSKWKFNADPCKEEEGPFTEIPIGTIFNSPLFYWRLFLLGRLNPYKHKPLGDGVPVSAPGQRFKLLTRWTHNTISVDGYNAALLSRGLRQYQRLKKEELVVIGHPKALTRFGLEALDRFIERKKAKHQFTTFREQRSQLI